MCQALDETGTDRVNDSHKNDGCRICCLCYHACLGHGDDHIDFVVDQVSPEFAISIRLISRISMQEHRVFAVDVTEITECLRQDIQINLLLLCTACVPKNADFYSSASLLRTRDERPNG